MDQLSYTFTHVAFHQSLERDICSTTSWPHVFVSWISCHTPSSTSLAICLRVGEGQGEAREAPRRRRGGPFQQKRLPTQNPFQIRKPETEPVSDPFQIRKSETAIRFRSANPKPALSGRNRLSQAETGSLRPFPALSHFGWLFQILFQMPFRICGSETDSVSAETVSVSADKASVSADEASVSAD